MGNEVPHMSILDAETDEVIVATQGAETNRRIPKPPRMFLGNPVLEVPASLKLDFDKGEWTDKTLAALDCLWPLGYSASSIGAYLGKTKNSVVGKAHRRDMPPRPSPIVRDGREPKDGGANRRSRERLQGPSLPPLASLATEPAPFVERPPIPTRTISPVVSRAISEVRKHLSAGKPSPFDNLAHRSVPAPQPIARPYSHFAKCQFIAGTWKIGQMPKFCDKPTFPARSYCEDCCRVCYQGFRGDAPPRVVDIDRFFPKPLNVPVSGLGRF